MENLITFLRTLNNLKKIKRKGWLVKKIKDPESVADHTTIVALLAMLFAKKYKADEEKLIKMALLHDLAEAEIGDDIGRHDGIDDREKHRMEKEAMKRFCSRIPEGGEWLKLWKEAEELKTKEAKLVKQFDKIDMVMQALEYEDEVDDLRKLDEFWEDADKIIGQGEMRWLFNKLILLRRKRK
jgi:putative hydrolase of HD superfamily